MIDALVRKKLGGFSLDAEISGSGFICLAGRNGAGKTTLMRALAGLASIGQGYVRIDGKDVSFLPAERRGIVLVTPSSSIPQIDVDSHITWGARVSGRAPSESALNGVKSRLGIDFAGRVGSLSLGMKERVILATALLSSSRVILVDEAFSNLHEKEAFIKTYRELTKSAGKEVLFSSQSESDGEFADHLFTIDNGRTIHTTEPHRAASN
jgi:molybdate/tungstate transport system ATP-binding protein